MQIAYVFNCSFSSNIAQRRTLIPAIRRAELSSNFELRAWKFNPSIGCLSSDEREEKTRSGNYWTRVITLISGRDYIMPALCVGNNITIARVRSPEVSVQR